MIPIIAESLRRVVTPRFFETERGFQGEFLAQLRARLPAADLPGSAVVEQEYQKRLAAHGTTIRPDIIVHVPTLPGADVRSGNFAAIELKLRAGAADARADFESLDTVLRLLNYPLGVFVNIDSAQTHAEAYRGPYGERIHFFAVRRNLDRPELRYARFESGRLVTTLQDRSASRE